MKTLLIVDSHALIHRAFHAIPPLSRAADGYPTNAIYGYYSMLHRTIVDLAPTHIAAAFDTPTTSFRKKLLPTYQVARKPTDDALKKQFGPIKEILDTSGIRRFEAPEFEADDVIGTLATSIARSNPDTKIIILTGDKDIFQVVTDKILVLTPQIGFSKAVLYDPQKVADKMGVPPDKITDFKALAGDPSDSYGGIAGIGPKTAAKLIAQFGSVEHMDTHFDAETYKTLLNMKQIATIVTTIPDAQPTLASLEFNGFNPEFKASLEAWDLHSLTARFFKNAKPKHPSAGGPKAEPKKNTDQNSLF